MKKLLNKSLLLLVTGFALASCGGTSESVSSVPSTPSTPDTPSVPVVEEGLSLEDYKAYVQYDLQNVLASIGVDKLEASVKAGVEAAFEAGKTAIDGAADVKAVQAAFANAKSAMAEVIPEANGLYSFIGKSNAEKTEILGILEAYAVRNGITGISLFENGGYVMYSDRVTLGTENYIPGYGFGVLAEGNITADLASETNPDWKRYYHTWNASDPGTANYLNDQGSEVADFYGYIGGSFFTTFMNESKDGYDWVPELANTKPEALDADYASTGMSKKWRFEVKTGADGLKYSTNSAMGNRKAFNNRPVELEDYITPFKLLLTKSNGYFRGSELANTTTGAIVGAKAYYESTAEQSMEEADFSKVGIRVYEENGKSYFEYEYTTPQTAFYSMYYITSSLYMPIPMEFLSLVTPANYLGFNEAKTETPVDNSLSLGSYVLETWNSEQEVVYKKNPNYVFADTKYAIPGVHINILPAANEDTEAGLKEFLAGNTDSSGIPQTRLEEFKSDPRTRHTTGDSNFKLNVNATDEETWEYLFGENGVVAQTPKSDYWKVEPALGNDHFVKALSLSIDRVSFADARGSIASVDYLSSNYMSDPENGISYSTTQAHKKAVAYLLENTDGCGYNLELAREYFKVALAELEADGKYVAGTKDNPTKIEIEIGWQYANNEDNYHKEIEQYLESAFNDESVSGGKYQLDVVFWVGEQWSDIYYNKMMLGQYDLGFGSINGNSLNPLDFVSVLSSDQAISGSFTLNWGKDTNDVDADIIVYEGQRWSYDALWTAANSVAVVVDGENANATTMELVSQTANEDGSYTSVMEVTNLYTDLLEVTIDDIVMCWYAGSYKEVSVLDVAQVTEENGVYTVTVTTDAETAAAYAGDMGFDIYYSIASGDLGTSSYASVYGYFGE